MFKNKREELSIVSYYTNLYKVYLPYLSQRVFNLSIEEVCGCIEEGKYAKKIAELGHNFAMYMLRVDSLSIKLNEDLLGIYLYSQICSVLGNSWGDLSEAERLYGAIQIAKVMLSDIVGETNISGLKYPIERVINTEEAPKKESKDVVVYPPDGYIVEENKRWDGVVEYSLKLKEGYKTSRVDIEAIDSKSDGTEILTLGAKTFDKRGILSYKIQGDARGEVVAKYWSVMFKEVLEYFKETRREEFLEIVEREILRGRNKAFVKYNPDGMDAPKYIGDGVYIEGHTGPNQIKGLLSILFTDLGLSLSDLEVCVKEGNSLKGVRRSM